MISFDLTEEQQMARDAVQGFAKSVLFPAAREADEAGELQKAALNGAWALGLVQSIADSSEGLPEQATVLNTLLLEELARGDAAVATAIAAPLGFVKAIAEQGSERQKKELLPLFATDAPRIAAVAMTDAGFARAGKAAVAAKAANGYRLNAAKALIPLAGMCSHFLVIAEGESGPDAFIVSRETAGVTVRAGKPTLGLRTLKPCEVQFQDVFVPMEMRLGENAGSNVQRIVDSSRVALSAILTGLSRTVLEYALPYTKERVVHGEAIAKKQAVAFKLADMHVDIEAMHWMALKAASELDRQESSVRSARLAQRYSADQAMFIADEGVQIFGGHGFAREFPLEMWYRNARSLSVLDGLVGA
jgi:alkylation response protein AidB-like acyl-CoA dehydrogenase